MLQPVLIPFPPSLKSPIFRVQLCVLNPFLSMDLELFHKEPSLVERMCDSDFLLATPSRRLFRESLQVFTPHPGPTGQTMLNSPRVSSAIPLLCA